MSSKEHRDQKLDYTKDPVKTVQYFKDELDINKIVANMMKGKEPPMYQGELFYGDVSDFSNLQEAFIKTQEARDLFMQYPADLREKFENDPVKFVEFLEDPKNLDSAIEMGLAEKRPENEGIKAQTSPATPEQGK